MTQQQTTSLDDDVKLYLHLADQIDALKAQQEDVKARLRAAGVGEHKTAVGLVTVRPPSRRFNLDQAWSFLTDEQRSVCLTPDAKLVKRQLPEALIDACMDPGTGDPTVVVKP